MNPNQGREAAYVTSRVKDLSLIQNTPDFVGCFACITPKAHSSLEQDENVVYMDVHGNIVPKPLTDTEQDEQKVYLPQLVRDVDTLTELFGDPRVDPKTYKDLYAIRNIVINGFACYIAKVRAGKSYRASVVATENPEDPDPQGLFKEPPTFNAQLTTDSWGDYDEDTKYKLGHLYEDLKNMRLFNVTSSLVGQNSLTVKLIPLKPFSLNQVCIDVVFKTRATPSSEEIDVCSARFLLTPDTKNSDLVKVLNSYLGGGVTLSLPEEMDDSQYASVYDAYQMIEPVDGHKYQCIANALLYISGLYWLKDRESEESSTVHVIDDATLLADNMEIYSYTDTNDKTYYGLNALQSEWLDYYLGKYAPGNPKGTTFECFVDVIESATLNVKQSDYVKSFSLYKDPKYSGTFISELSSDVVRTRVDQSGEVTELTEISSDERRGLHYIIKSVAALRKDLTCIFTTPFAPYLDESSEREIFDLNRACNWVAARNEYVDLFEYGNSQAVSYEEQAFYCEMYWSWLKWRVPKLVNGVASVSIPIVVPATSFVILNALNSFRTRGSFYPVAGDQGGVLPESCTILQNPSTKTQRDKLISYRINPIFDTGLRGIQIYGNETLNPQYTDLSAAHIARTLVLIRSRVDAYSETIKFSLNDIYTWSSWINYVSTKILDPIKSLGGLQWYQVDMGYNTTTRDEISSRKIRGMISLQFTQALEIIDLEFVVYASSLELGDNG